MREIAVAGVVSRGGRQAVGFADGKVNRPPGSKTFRLRRNKGAPGRGRLGQFQVSHRTTGMWWRWLIVTKTYSADLAY